MKFSGAGGNVKKNENIRVCGGGEGGFDPAGGRQDRGQKRRADRDCQGSAGSQPPRSSPPTSATWPPPATPTSRPRCSNGSKFDQAKLDDVCAGIHSLIKLPDPAGRTLCAIEMDDRPRALPRLLPHRRHRRRLRVPPRRPRPDLHPLPQVRQRLPPQRRLRSGPHQPHPRRHHRPRGRTPPACPRAS